MKFDRNKAFPYPVLRPYSDDYVNVDFQTAVNFQITEEHVCVAVDYTISSKAILGEIQKRRAVYVSVVSCRDTYFREVLPSSKSNLAHQFDAGQLRGEVRIDPYVVIMKAVPKYSASEINPEFQKKTFTFSPGDILAQDESQVFYIERDLFKPITSVFDLVKNDALSGGEWLIGLEENHVQIEVSPETKETIDGARNNKNHKVTLLNSLYFAAVVHAVQKLKESGDAYENNRWADVMLKQINNNGLDLQKEEAYVLAQRLMKNPLSLLSTYVLKG
jgi:hypothetical protein